MGSLEETPRDIQVAAESFVPAKAFLPFVQALVLDQQPSATTGRVSEVVLDSQQVRPSHRSGPAGDYVSAIVYGEYRSALARFLVRF